MMFKFILAALFTTSPSSANEVAPNFHQFVNDMADHWKSGATFNQTKYDDILSCMTEDDDLLVESQDAMWRHIREFY